MGATDPRLFRKEALEHFLDLEEGPALPRVSPPWTWTLLVLLLAALAAGIIASVVGQVEVTGRGRGILRPEAGIRTLVAQVEGTIAQVQARSGQRVLEGAILLSVDAPALRARLHEAQRATGAVRREFQDVQGEQDRVYRLLCARLKARTARLEEQVVSQQGSVARSQGRLEGCDALARDGIRSPAQVEDAREELAQAKRALNLALQALDQAHQERAALGHQRQESLWQRSRTIQSAETREEALAFLQAQTLVRAPRDGVLEALLARPGEVVGPGKVLGRLVPLDGPLEVICFLAERHRAFVKPGAAALLELDQLPYAEFGTLKARVLRIGTDLASPQEVQEALGDGQALQAPSVRVELELTDPRAAVEAKAPLLPGMLMDVRFTLRRQRLITLVLAPLRSWLR